METKVGILRDNGGGQDANRHKAESTLRRDNLFLVPFLNFFSYATFIPFFTVLDKKSDAFYFKSSPIHTVLCFLTHVLVNLCSVNGFLAFLKYYLTSGRPKDIVTFFELVSYTASSISSALLTNILWRHKSELLEVLEVTRIQVKDKVGFNWMRLLTFIVFTTSSASIGFISWLMVSEEAHFAYADLFWRQINSPFGMMSAVRMTVKVLLWHNSNFYMSNQGLLAVLSTTVVFLGWEFKQNMTNLMMAPCVHHDKIEKGITLYKEMKAKIAKVNRLFGGYILYVYVSSVVYFGEAPYVLEGLRGNAEQIMFICFMGSGVVWLMAADFHYQVRSSTLKWLELNLNCDMVSTVDRLRLLAIANELESDPIALSSKYFPMTYTHLSSMVGLILTYALIVMQMQAGQCT